MYKGKTKYIIQTFVIALLYIILTIIADQFGMAKNIVQIRISDALAVLPYFTPAAIPGLFIGCFVSNGVISLAPDPMTGKMALTTAAQYYVIYGSIATLIGAIGGFIIRKYKFLVGVPTIIANTIAMPLIFKFVFRYDERLLKCVMTVGIGELIACGFLGVALLMALEDSKDKLFPTEDKILEEVKDEETAGVVTKDISNIAVSKAEADATEGTIETIAVEKAEKSL